MATHTYRKSTFVRHMAGSPLLRMTVAWSMICGQIVLAAPQGAEVVNGQASISQQGDLTQITAGNNAIINYNSFDIASHETVQFIQPSASSKVLNRIAGHDPTQINGSLLANGRVYIVNPAGIYFGNGALVDVGGFFAAASNITNNDFINNVDQFTDATGSVVNYGTIQGDMVHLIGKHVANHGSILASEGLVSMVAGDDVLLGERNGHFMVKLTGAAAGMGDTAGVENTGKIDAAKGKVHLGAGDLYSLVLHENSVVTGNQITVEGGDGSTVEVAGTLDASNTDAGQVGGSVHVLGDNVNVNGAQIDASGDAGGGEVLIGGDLQGGNDSIRNATRTFVGSDAHINADALSSGDGGKVIVWADGATHFAGSISARGGAQSGDGGFAEVSGKEQLNFNGSVDLTAAHGSNGTLLLDPKTITVVEAEVPSVANLDGDDPDDGGELGDDLGNMAEVNDIDFLNSLADDVESVITNVAVEMLLDTADLILAATTSITIDAPIAHDTATKLTLDAMTVDLNALITLSNGASLTGSADTVNLNAHIILSNDESLTGSATTVNVNEDGMILNGIAVAASGGEIAVNGSRNLLGDYTATNVSLVFNDVITLTGDVAIVTSDETIPASGGAITFNDTIDGPYDLTLNSGTATTTFSDDAVVGGADPLMGLNITADALVIGSGDIDIASGSTVVIRPATDGHLIALGTDDVAATDDEPGTLGLTDDELDQFNFPDTKGSLVLEIGRLSAGGISIDANITLGSTRVDTLKLVTGAGVSGTGTLDVENLVLNVGSFGTSNTPIETTVSTLGVVSTSNVYVTNTKALDLAASSVGGDLVVVTATTTGHLTNSGMVDVGGNAKFTTSGSNADIDLGLLAVTGTVSLNTSGGTGNATVVNATALDLAASNVGGDLIATATTGDLTDQGAVDVGDDAEFTTSEPNADIDLEDLEVSGSVKLTTAGDDGNATVVNDTTLDLAASNVGGDLVATATTGNLTDQGAVDVGGDAEFRTVATNADIDLEDLEVSGSVKLTTAGDDGNATVVNDTTLDLAASNVGGDLVATATTGDLTTDSGTVDVGGDAEFTTDADNANITLTELAVTGTVKLTTNGSEGDATVVNTTALKLATLSNVGGDLNATATMGNLTDSGSLTVGGNAVFTTLASGADIILDGLSNSIDSVAVNTAGLGGDAKIRESSELTLNNSNVGGDLTLIVDSLAFAAEDTAITSGGVTAIETFSGIDVRLGVNGSGLALSGNDLARFNPGQGLRVGNTTNTDQIFVSDTLVFGGDPIIEGDDPITYDTLGLFTTMGVTVAEGDGGTGKLNVNRLAIHNTAATGVTLDTDVSNLAVHTAGSGDIEIHNTGDLTITEVTGLTGLKTVNQDIEITTTGSLTFSADVSDGVGSVVSTGTGMAAFIAGGAIIDTGTAPLLIGGTATFVTQVDGGAAITLNNESSTFGTVTAISLTGVNEKIGQFLAAGDITIVENGDMNLALVETSGTGTFTAINGTITDSDVLDERLLILGAASFVTRRDTGANITLDNGNSTFGAITARTLNEDGDALPAGVISVSIDITEGADMVLASVQTTGTGTFTAINGTITDSGTLTIGGAASFVTQSVAGKNITLNDSNSTFGAITAHTLDVDGGDKTGDVVGGSIQIFENAAMDLASIKTAGSSVFESNTGGILDSGEVRSDVDAKFITKGNSADVVLDSLNVGAVILDVDRDATVTTDNLHIRGTVGNKLAAESPNGALTLNGDLTVMGPAVMMGLDVINSANLTAETNIHIGAGEVAATLLAQGGATINAADVNIANNGSQIAGSGNLDFLPTTVGQSIGIGTNTSGFDLTNDEIGQIQDGFDMITFGRSDGAHNITIGNVDFKDSVTIQTNAPGKITLNGDLTTLAGSDAASIKLDGKVLLGDSTQIFVIPSVGGDIHITGPVDNTTQVVSSLDLVVNSGTITLDDNVGAIANLASVLFIADAIAMHEVITVGDQFYLASGSITLSSKYRSAGPGGIFFDGDVILEDDVDVLTADGHILFAGMINGDHALTLRAGVAEDGSVTGSGNVELLQEVGGGTGNNVGSLTAIAANHIFFDASIHSNGEVSADAKGGNLNVHDITGYNLNEGITLRTDNNGLIAISGTLTTNKGDVQLGRNLTSVPLVATIVGQDLLDPSDPFGAKDIAINTDGGTVTIGRNQKMTARNISIVTEGGDATVGDLGAVNNLTLDLGIGTLFVNLRQKSLVETIEGDITDEGVDLVAGGVLSITAKSLASNPDTSGVRPVLASPMLQITVDESIKRGVTKDVFNVFMKGSQILDLAAGFNVVERAGFLNNASSLAPQDAEIAAVPDEENLEVGEKELLRIMGVPAEDLTAEQLLAIATGEGLPWLINDIGSIDGDADEGVVTVVRMLKRAVPAALALYKTIYISDEVDEEGNAVAGSKSQRIREVLTQAWIDYSVSGAEADSVDFEQYLRTAPDTEEAWTYVVLLRALFDQLEIMGLTDRELGHTKFVLLEREGIIPKGMTLPEFEGLLFGSQEEVVSVPTDDDLLSLHPLKVQDVY